MIPAASWLSFDPNSLSFSGNPPINSGAGIYTITVKADDTSPHSSTSTGDFALFVKANSAPSVDQGITNPEEH